MAGGSQDPSGYGPSIGSFRLCGSIPFAKALIFVSIPAHLQHPRHGVQKIAFVPRGYAASIEKSSYLMFRAWGSRVTGPPSFPLRLGLPITAGEADKAGKDKLPARFRLPPAACIWPGGSLEYPGRSPIDLEVLASRGAACFAPLSSARSPIKISKLIQPPQLIDLRKIIGGYRYVNRSPQGNLGRSASRTAELITIG
ncbi:hypothetical protein B9Z19DRAFT_1067662 [Tuber borchii]|uniref:Uncharacterized protein n=1 Tax=Tuber borchii TaxID=42251 RepID=A0A2T6ZI34_TUBBO|nr:hypothetical protein B9Z19DRAFT_1067662 [Tuber borchii]